MNRVILLPAEITGIFEGQANGRERESGTASAADSLRPFLGKHPVFRTDRHENAGTTQPIPTVSLEVDRLFAPEKCFTAALELSRYPTHIGFSAKAKDVRADGPMRAFPSGYDDLPNLAQAIDKNLVVLVGMLSAYYRRDSAYNRPHVAKATFNPPKALREAMGTYFEQFPNPNAINCVSIRPHENKLAQNSLIDGLLLVPVLGNFNGTFHVNPMLSGIVLGTSSRS